MNKYKVGDKIKQKRINKKTYLLILLSLFSVFILSSCSVFQSIGLGKAVSEERQVSGIESVSVGSNINLIIEQTGTESVRIQAAENIIPNVSTKVVDGELQISLIEGGIKSIRPINCYVGIIDLNTIKVSSSATVKCENLKTENLSIEMASSANGSLTIYVTNLDLMIASSAHLTLSGEAESQNIRVNSSGNLKAYDLASRDCTIDVQSSGNANINVTDNLDAKVSSSANLNYKGSPKVNSDISSGGKINKVGN